MKKSANSEGSVSLRKNIEYGKQRTVLISIPRDS